MFRIFTRPKGAPINDPRVGQPMWSKPGTPLDHVRKLLPGSALGRRSVPDMSIRQQRRQYLRAGI